MLEAPKLGRVAHDMHSRAGADYGELFLETKELAAFYGSYSGSKEVLPWPVAAPES